MRDWVSSVGASIPMKVLVKGEVGCSIPLTNNLPMAAVSNVRRSRIGDVVEVRRAARPYDAGDIE